MAEKTLQTRLRETALRMTEYDPYDLVYEAADELDLLTAQLREARELLEKYRTTVLKFTAGSDNKNGECGCLQCRNDRFLAATEPKS